MSNYRRANTEGATYFFTVVTYHRKRILCNDDIRKALREGIREVQKIHPFTIDGWILLPDHLHCIWTLPPNDADFSIRWAMIKRYVSKHCRLYYCDNQMTDSKRKRKESTLWQRRFWEHKIRDDRDFETHMDYLHYNPVKHGLTKHVKDWPYSSFHRYANEGVYVEDWGGVDFVGMEFGE